ncbi:maleylpyruvate isomerase family mycothiol-dependent enzyme [Longispora sp. K20-0274]|uniref:maleylpyruvate isomerase family mycothiol-dependent enzyme n=1 Tax=Longispora sp. K20-0274 TaxID=3088255 RepID=UPI0039996C00
MTTDPLALLAELDRATARLIRTVGGLTDKEVAAPSLLPGWTRGHVLTHLARNADGLVNLLTWAESGVRTPMYTSYEDRVAAVEAGAGRAAGEYLADVTSSSQGFADRAAKVPADAWQAVVWTLNEKRIPALTVPWLRLKEVEIHHADLGADYGSASWPESFVRRLLREVTHDFTGRQDAPRMVLTATDLGAQYVVGDGEGAPTISGPGHALAAWLIGRGAHKSLVGTLPTLPSWG